MNLSEKYEQIHIIDRYKITGKHLGIDYSGTDFSHVYLSEDDMRFTNLQGAFLMHADLRGTNLVGANLSKSDLRYAKIMGAKLYRTEMKEILIDKKTFYSLSKKIREQFENPVLVD